MKALALLIGAGVVLLQLHVGFCQSDDAARGGTGRASGGGRWTVAFSAPKTMWMFDEYTTTLVCNISLTKNTSNINCTRPGPALITVYDLADFLASLENRTYVSLIDTVSTASISAAMVVSTEVQLFASNMSTNVSGPETGLLGRVLIKLQAYRVGRTSIAVKVRAAEDSANDTQVSQTQVTVVRELRTIDIVFRWLITGFIIFVTFGMGCELDLKIIFTIMKKPFAPLIGLASQYVLMPLISIAIGQIFLRSEEMKMFGFGLLALGCSPGGGGSNMWTVMLGGDLNLSMTMTAISTTLALGMMPLWLFLAAPLYVDVERLQIPYIQIVVQLAMFVGPTLLGVAFKSWKPKWAQYLKKPVRFGSLGFIILMMSFGTWVNLYMFRTIGYFPYLLPIGALLPWCGFLFGYIVAFILRQGHKRSLTIAIETGIQNIGVPMLILRFAFPPPEGDIGAVMVMIAAMFTPLPLYLALASRGIYRCVKKCTKKDKKDTKEDTDEVDEKAANADRQADEFLNGEPKYRDDEEATLPLTSFKNSKGTNNGLDEDSRRSSSDKE